MKKGWKAFQTMIWLFIAVLLEMAWFSLFAAYALSNLKIRDIHGTALWVFLIIGTIIILMQLIPAVILFLGFVKGNIFEGNKKK